MCADPAFAPVPWAPDTHGATRQAGEEPAARAGRGWEAKAGVSGTAGWALHTSTLPGALCAQGRGRTLGHSVSPLMPAFRELRVAVWWAGGDCGVPGLARPRGTGQQTGVPGEVGEWTGVRGWGSSEAGLVQGGPLGTF